MSHFYTPWKQLKNFGFQTFSEGIEMGHWREKSLFVWIRSKLEGKILAMNPYGKLYSTKTENRTQKILNQKIVLHCFEVT